MMRIFIIQVHDHPVIHPFSVYIVYFLCDSASEFGAMGSTSFLGFPTLTWLLFLNLLFLGTCIMFFIFIYLYLILGELVTAGIRFFALKSKKEKGTG